MNFRAEMKERFDRVEFELRELAGKVEALVKIAEKRDEVEAQVRVAQLSDPSDMYEKEYKEEEDEDLAGGIVDWRERKEA